MRLENYWTPKRIRLSSRYQFDVYRLARELADRQSARVIYDVGCGPATKLMRFFGDQYTVIGFDRPEAVAFCRKTYRRGTFLEADLEHVFSRNTLDIPPADIVICADVIEHLQRPDQLVTALAALAGESGTIIISTPERDKLRGPLNRMPTNPEHVREWNGAEFMKFLSGCGLEVVEHRLQPQLRPGASLSAWRWVVGQWIGGRTHQTNQVVVCLAPQSASPHDIERTQQ
ncbi:class I SAM-dependent methyltransferase [Rosistilla carotiformis]